MAACDMPAQSGEVWRKVAITVRAWLVSMLVYIVAALQVTREILKGS
jgi:type II secretory pathway component PulL